METRTQPDTRRQDRHIPGIAGPILVATDGLPQSDGALAMARALGRRLHAAVQVFTVYRLPAMLVPEAQLLLDGDAAATLRADLERRVRHQCARVLGDETAFRALRDGEPQRVISRIAVEQGAQLVVVGIGRHEIVDRVFGSETALKLARSSRVPVLAVPPLCSTPPQRAIAAVDFSAPSARAAQLALHLVADGGVVQLAHVEPRERVLVDAWISQKDYDAFVKHHFTRLIGQLDVRPGVDIADVVLRGDPARVLLEFGARTNADLIAIGSHGHGYVSRMMLGSVTTSVVRGASCAVLVVPREAFGDVRAASGAARTGRIARARWGAVLDDFTRQNAGRRTRLEVDDPKLGAQAQEDDYPLVGVSYDPHDQRIEIMLGELGVAEPHLSRSIGAVDAVELLTDEEDRDIALRVVHGSGQTILTFGS